MPNQPRVPKNLDEEIAMAVEFVESTPFPTYDIMCNLITLRHPQQIMIRAEYSELNHELLKECYEHIGDKQRCANAGKIIHNNGGLHAMTMVFEAYRNFSPFNSKKARDMNVNALYRMLEFHWDNIGDWRA